MLEPLTAIGLASSIVQLLDFSATVLSEAHKISGASAGALPYAEQVELMVLKDKQFMRTLLAAKSEPGVQGPEERIVVSRAQDCAEQIESLLEILSTLKLTAKADGTRSRTKALWKALSGVKKSKAIEKRTNELHTARVQLHGALLQMIGDQQDSNFVELLSQIRQSGKDTANVIDASRDDILKTLATQSARADKNSSAFEQRLRESESRNETRHSNVMQCLDSQTLREEAEFANFERLLKRVQETQEKDAASQKKKTILETLDFSQMEERWSTIEHAHSGTFNWAIESSDSSFQRWIRSSDGLYWIEGKAGSGKSTLMKYLRSRPEIQKALSQWAGERTLIIAEHYFWYAGAELQRTSQGMLQALLYKTLRADLDLIPIVCQDRWSAEGQRLYDNWSLDELTSALDKLGSISTIKFCFFIDGLDEYHPHSQQSYLITIIDRLARYPNMKLCVSSRPWQIFYTAWRELEWKIRLQDLTQRDILAFSHHMLTSASHSQSFASAQEIEGLCRDICARAHGVFLWVSLATGALCERISAGQGFEQLEMCLDSFPKSLYSYFYSRIYERINSTWERDTALALKLAVLCTLSNPKYPSMSLMTWKTFWFLAQSMRKGGLLLDAGFALNDSIGKLPRVARSDMVATTKAFLNACARDFLQCSDAAANGVSSDEESPLCDLQVSFLHRTAFDFLNTEEMQALLDRHVPQHFCDPSFPRHIGLALLKASESKNEGICAAMAVFHAGGTPGRGECSEIIDECDSTVAFKCGGQPLVRHSNEDIKLVKLLCDLAAHHSPNHYAIFSILEANSELLEDRNTYNIPECYPILGAALGLLPEHGEPPLEHVNIELVRWLLAAGARPRYGTQDCHITIWQRYIRKWARQRWPSLSEDENPEPSNKTKGHSSKDDEKIWTLTKVLLTYGPDLNEYVCLDSVPCQNSFGWKDEQKQQHLRIREVLNILLLPHQLDELSIHEQNTIQQSPNHMLDET